jgi:hypothetical protein
MIREMAGVPSKPPVEISKAGGMALLISMIILAMLSLMGLYVAVNATTEIRISDNFESEIRARFAACAGLDHARSALKGLDFDDQLKGPDGVYDGTAPYTTQARTFGFRNLLPWTTARALNLLDPSGEVSGLPDDGLLNSGQYLSVPGTILIPLMGMALTAPNPNGPGSLITARYFVKITDNNGEASETAKDPSDSPFVDGDGLIIVRSIGVASMIRDRSGSILRNNSVAVFEARFKRRSTFDQDAALLVQAVDVQPSASVMFEDDSFSIRGGVGNPGIAAIDADIGDTREPAHQIRSMVAPIQEDNIQGAGGSNSIQDITAAIASDPEKALLLDEHFLQDFVQNKVRRFADSVFLGNQNWDGVPAPDLGVYDSTLPPNAPVQRPRVTFVDGDLTIGGGASGGGLLIVTGKLAATGNLTFNGLVMLVGKGDLDARGSICSVTGGIYLASIASSEGFLSWGPVRLSVGGNCEIRFDRRTIRMATSLIPPVQAGFREITSAMDP